MIACCIFKHTFYEAKNENMDKTIFSFVSSNNLSYRMSLGILQMNPEYPSLHKH